MDGSGRSGHGNIEDEDGRRDVHRENEELIVQSSIRTLIDVADGRLKYGSD